MKSLLLFVGKASTIAVILALILVLIVAVEPKRSGLAPSKSVNPHADMTLLEWTTLVDGIDYQLSEIDPTATAEEIAAKIENIRRRIAISKLPQNLPED